MMTEDMLKMMIKSILPLKFDTNIKISSEGSEDLEVNFKGDIFIRRMKGETSDRIIIAIKLPEESAKYMENIL